MKYLIKESQLNKVIFKYLDNQDFVQLEKVSSIYFLNFEDDTNAQIKVNETSRWCTISRSLMDEVASFFSLKNYESMSIIARWVENKLGLEFGTVESQSNIVVYYF